MKNALIFFTKEPVAGKSKTRLLPKFSAAECAEIQTAMLKDLEVSSRNCEVDRYIAYDNSEEPVILKEIFGSDSIYFPQEGPDLGTRMYNAIKYCLNKGYDRVVLCGSDIPELSSSVIMSAFDALEHSDTVFGPALDGGYYLVGVRRDIPEIFKLEKYSHSEVLSDTIKLVSKAGASYSLLDKLSDLDEPNDYTVLLDRITYEHILKDTYIKKKVIELASVSLVIPVYNEEKNIDNLLFSIEKLKKSMEIIFVDGGSTDNTKEIIGRNFRIVSSEKGRANQMNYGASVSKGDIVLFLHADCILPDNPVAEIKKVLKTAPVGSFGLSFLDKTPLMRYCAFASNRRARHGVIFGDQGLFITRTLFERVGHFPSIAIMEDYQISHNILDMGIKPGFTEKRILASTRRYDGSLWYKIKVMIHMLYLRHLYRKGVDINEIGRMYRDIR